MFVSLCLPDSSVLSLRYLTCPLPTPLTSPAPRLVISVSVYTVFVVPAFLVSLCVCDVPHELPCVSSHISIGVFWISYFCILI